MSKIMLRDRYYLEHFDYLITFIKTHYLSLLDASELNFVQAYEQLTLPARCLLARLYNRQRLYYAVSTLQYPEIENTALCLTELAQHNFVAILTATTALNLDDFLTSRTRQQLWQAALIFKCDVAHTATKPDLIAALSTAAINTTTLLQFFIQTEPLIYLPYRAAYATLQFLLFGNLQYTMAQFVVKELQGAAPVIFQADAQSPRFTVRAEVTEGLAVQTAYLTFKQQRHKITPGALYAWFMDWCQANSLSTEFAQRAYGKLAVSVAGYFEKVKLKVEALQIYATTNTPPARERQLRLHAQLKQTAAAQQLCATMLSEPANAQEAALARDYLNKLLHKQHKKATTLYLDRSEKLNLTVTPQLKPERAVIAHLQQMGYCAYFAENYLWRGFFGLLFWDIVFATDATYLHHPFQLLPTDLTQGKILSTRAQLIEQRLTLLAHKLTCAALLRRHYYANYAKPNGIVSWHPDLLQLIEHCYHLLTPAQLRTILTEMARDWRHNSSGFPDLLCWRGDAYYFVEVKSVNDKLSAQQVKWLRLFAELGVNAKVLHLTVTNAP